MAPKRQRLAGRDNPFMIEPQPRADTSKKRVTKAQKERGICEKKIKILEQEESFLTEDRFTQVERGQLLDAYDKLGFQVFQDMNLLQKFLPGRTERDLKGLMDRLRLGLQQEHTTDAGDRDTLDAWLKLCHDLMGNFAKDKRVSLDEALADALMMVADERELNQQNDQTEVDANHQVTSAVPNYPELLRSFSQLLLGKFPNNMTPSNAKISLKLFDHITNLVDSMNLDEITDSLESAEWLKTSFDERRRRQEMAMLGLGELDCNLKKSLSIRDLSSRNVEALCLELPKIKRINELLNPLNFNESLLNSLMDL